MLTNADMKPARFLRWHEARQRLAEIHCAFDAGRSIAVASYTRPTWYGPKCRDMFKATRSGLYVRRGQAWNCLNFSKILIERA